MRPYYKEGGKWHIDLDWLEVQLDCGRSLSSIAREIGCSTSVVKRYAERLQNRTNNVKFDGLLQYLKRLHYSIKDVIIDNSNKQVIIKVSNPSTIIELHQNSKYRELEDKWLEQGYEVVTTVNR